jgi:hypothetical protein
MYSIHLPLNGCLRLAAWGIILASMALVLVGHAAWPWRVAGAALVLGTGVLLWRRYQKRRPVTLRACALGGLSCTLADGREVRIAQSQLGVVRPWLVSARLRTAGGERLDLFVPGRSLGGDAHWQLRRALLAFRPEVGAAEPDPSNGRSGV